MGAVGEFNRFYAILERARVRNAKRLLAAATLLRDEHIRNLSGINPDGSSPAAKGEFPKQRTGETAKTVIMLPDTLAGAVKEGRIRVGLKAGTKRPGSLYHHGWLGVRDTRNRIRARLKAILSGEG